MPETADTAYVLIVDDNPANLDLLAQLLRAQNYHVRAVPSGSMAIESARLSPPDLILLDVMMPGMDGYETCRTLKSDEMLRNIPVIFISASDDVVDKVKAFEVGGNDYVTKPFSTEEVLARVRHQILLRRLQSSVQERTMHLEEANRKLLEMENIKERFTAMLTHDLRSPLAAISGYLELAALGNEEARKSCLRNADHALESVMMLIDDLMEVYRSSRTELRVEYKRVRLSDIARNVILIHENQALKCGITLALEFRDPITEVMADARLVERALSNLTGNALKCTPRGGSVRIVLEELQEDDVTPARLWIRVTVKDTGRGIPAKQLPFIFDPFRQVVLGDASVGFGLGLAIVKQIVAAHKGHIRVDSEEGKGSTIALLFPALVHELP